MHMPIGKAARVLATLTLLGSFAASLRAQTGPLDGWAPLDQTQSLGPTQAETFPVPLQPPTTLFFGAALAIHRDTALVGMPGYPGELNETPAGPYDQGAVALFMRQDGSWTRAGTLRPSDPTGDDFFGEGIALRGNIAAVQAQSGVYVFRRAKGSWTQTQKVLPPASLRMDGGLALGGGMLFAGAPAYGEPGAVYVFERDGHGVWRLVQTLSSGDGVNSDYFGAQIAVSGESLAIGAPGEAQGAVFVYERRGNRWIERQKLVAGDEQSGQFGAALALSQDRLVIGAAGADFDPSGLCGPPDAAGAVYVFALAAGEWTQQQKIPTPVPHCTFNFGVTVAVDRHVLVGATPSTFPYTVGGVYAYKRQGASYVPLAGALDSSSDSTPILGLSGCTLMMGLPFDRGFSTGTVEVFDACGTSNSTAAPAADVASSGAQ